MRITQTIMGIIMILIGAYMYIQLRNENLLKKINSLPLIGLVLFGIMVLYNGLTSTVLLKNMTSLKTLNKTIK